MVHPLDNHAPIVISRFHWHVATIWTEPILTNGMPCASFTKLVHTPIIESSNYDWRYLEIEPNLPQIERSQIVELYLPAFKRTLRSKKNKFLNSAGYGNLIVSNGVPTRYEMKLDDFKSAVVVGRMFNEADAPVPIRRKLWGMSSSIVG